MSAVKRTFVVGVPLVATVIRDEDSTFTEVRFDVDLSELSEAETIEGAWTDEVEDDLQRVIAAADQVHNNLSINLSIPQEA